MKTLNIQTFIEEARYFSKKESQHNEPSLFGVTDGKAIGTYFEHKFKNYLKDKYDFNPGNSANGIDFPSLDTDMKVTSYKQPQSSCPYKAARQKIYGLGYNLIVFVYQKYDDSRTRMGRLDIVDTVFIESHRTSDYQLTAEIRNILSNNGNRDDLMALMLDKNLPVDEIELNRLADEILSNPPFQGYLTISNALQWRLQYSRVIQFAGQIDGICSIVKSGN